MTAAAVCRGSLCAGARPRHPRFVEVGSLVMERGHCPGPVVRAKDISDFRGSRGYGLRCPGNAFCVQLALIGIREANWKEAGVRDRDLSLIS